jgi:hypothetical protein
MPPFNLSQLESIPTPEPEAQAPAHAKGASTAEVPTKTPTKRLLKGWAIILQSLKVCMMAVPDHKPDFLLVGRSGGVDAQVSLYEGKHA